MKVSKKLILIITALLVLLVGGGVAYATNTPTARAERQLNLGNKYLQEGSTLASTTVKPLISLVSLPISKVYQIRIFLCFCQPSLPAKIRGEERMK